MTSIMLIHFVSLYLKSFIQNLVINGPGVSEKSKIKFSTMMGWSHRCCIPSFMEIGKLVLGKIFTGFLPHMHIAAIWTM